MGSIKQYLIVLSISLFAIIGCQTETRKNDQAHIVVTILPQKYFVDRITGETLAVTVMVPPGSNPATYEPLPRQMQNLEKAGIYLIMGHLGFENTWLNKMSEINPEMNITDLSNGIDMLMSDHSHSNDYHSHVTDPHIWLSIDNAGIIAKNIYNSLILYKPESKELFEQNYLILLSEIDSLKETASKKLDGTRTKSFLIYHPSLSYLAHEFGLNQISIENEGKEPTPSNLTAIIRTAREKNIKCVFIQKQFNIEKANIIAKEINAQIIQIDPLAYNWFESMNNITTELANALN